MLHIHVEMWPQGDRRRAYHLGTAFIANVGGDAATGDYDVKLLKSPRYARTPGTWKRAQVKGFPRQRLGPWDLLLRGLAACIAARNPGAAALAETGDIGGAPALIAAERQRDDLAQALEKLSIMIFADYEGTAEQHQISERLAREAAPIFEALGMEFVDGAYGFDWPLSEQGGQQT